MQLHHAFVVPADIETAWSALNDLERVASCMPGAALTEVEGDHFEGRVKIRVGPVQLTYHGEGTRTELDAEARRIGIEAAGKEHRGQGTARATVQAALTPTAVDRTEVSITTDLDVTGKPAQFGRGVMNDVGQKLLDRFADQLAAQLEGGLEPAGVAAGGTSDDRRPRPSPTPGGTGASDTSAPAPFSVPPHPWPPEPQGTDTDVPRSQPRPADDDEALDLLEVAGGVIGRRLAPAVAGLAAVLVLWLVVRRRR